MCPWKYPSVMIRIAKRKQAMSDSTSGMVGLGFIDLYIK